MRAPGSASRSMEGQQHQVVIVHPDEVAGSGVRGYGIAKLAIGVHIRLPAGRIELHAVRESNETGARWPGSGNPRKNLQPISPGRATGMAPWFSQPRISSARAGSPLSSVSPDQPIQMPPVRRRMGFMAVARPPELGAVIHFPSSPRWSVMGSRLETTMSRFGGIHAGERVSFRSFVSGGTPKGDARGHGYSACNTEQRPMPNRSAGPEPDPLWYKDAIIYEVHVTRLPRRQRRRHGRFRRAHRQARLPGRAWELPPSGCCPSAHRRGRMTDTTFRTTPTCIPAYGTLRDFEVFPARGPPPRVAGDHRTGTKPYLRPARLVPALAARRTRLPLAQLLCLERHAGQVQGGAYHLQGFRGLQLDLGSRGARILLAPLLRAPARSELRQSRGADAAMLKAVELLARSGRGRPAAGRRALSLRARRHQLREPARNARLPATSCAPTSTANTPAA